MLVSTTAAVAVVFAAISMAAPVEKSLWPGKYGVRNALGVEVSSNTTLSSLGRPWDLVESAELAVVDPMCSFALRPSLGAGALRAGLLVPGGPRSSGAPSFVRIADVKSLGVFDSAVMSSGSVNICAAPYVADATWAVYGCGTSVCVIKDGSFRPSFPLPGSGSSVSLSDAHGIFPLALSQVDATNGEEKVKKEKVKEEERAGRHQGHDDVETDNSENDSLGRVHMRSSRRRLALARSSMGMNVGAAGTTGSLVVSFVSRPLTGLARRVVALDGDSGTPIWTSVDMAAGVQLVTVGDPPLFFNGHAFFSTTEGLAAFDIGTGRFVMAMPYHTVQGSSSISAPSACGSHVFVASSGTLWAIGVGAEKLQPNGTRGGAIGDPVSIHSFGGSIPVRGAAPSCRVEGDGTVRIVMSHGFGATGLAWLPAAIATGSVATVEWRTDLPAALTAALQTWCPAGTTTEEHNSCMLWACTRITDVAVCSGASPLTAAAFDLTTGTLSWTLWDGSEPTGKHTFPVTFADGGILAMSSAAVTRFETSNNQARGTLVAAALSPPAPPAPSKVDVDCGSDRACRVTFTPAPGSGWDLPEVTYSGSLSITDPTGPFGGHQCSVATFGRNGTDILSSAVLPAGNMGLFDATGPIDAGCVGVNSVQVSARIVVHNSVTGLTSDPATLKTVVTFPGKNSPTPSGTSSPNPGGTSPSPNPNGNSPSPGPGSGGGSSSSFPTLYVAVGGGVAVVGAIFAIVICRRQSRPPATLVYTNMASHQQPIIAQNYAPPQAYR